MAKNLGTLRNSTVKGMPRVYSVVQECTASNFGEISVFVANPAVASNNELLSGARILLTGASKGIGEQMAYHYARFGGELVITARNKTLLKQVEEKCLQLGAKKVYSVSADMSDPKSADRVVKFALEKLGSLGYLVLNHIGNDPFEMWNGDAEQTRWLMQVNFLSYVQLTAAALPTLLKTNGSIIVISSLCGKIAVPYVASYSASKFALEGFFNSLRYELTMQKKNVSITLCILGLIDTESAMEKIRARGLTKLSPYPASETALNIIRGGTVRSQEIYCPWWTEVIVRTRDWFTAVKNKLIASSTPVT
ncbi:hydroxysteroid 11-beta-dehydrogenase 1-like protein isoform X2 [Pristis pectinata]|uniref:hydroxysteroid 11-beta-dehydrogenase 1-like protein isoform X2 n=1 Tax=Pristis pectinata TaxID=685728 RepID=UPI00223CD805|nr:hydroxysteroid 11-beta-dehydrogenase 1-like protein isoform X2 [Pristis pectinata]